jgi:nicotinamidase-related amidase
MFKVESYGGRVFEFDARSAALIVIDMQHDFCSRNGACAAGGADVSLVEQAIPKIRSVLDAARRGGLLVVHTRYGFRPDLTDLADSVQRQSREAGGEYGTPGPMGRILTRGEPGHEIIDELRPVAGEPVIDKTGNGAFYATQLHDILLKRRITHLIFMGVTTQCCVESTLREAIDRSFYCLTLYDCCAAFDQTLHNATFAAIQSEGHLFGWVANSPAVLSALNQTRSVAAQ